MSEHVRDLDDATKLHDLAAPLDDVGARFRSRALAAEAECARLRARLEEATELLHTIDDAAYDLSVLQDTAVTVSALLAAGDS